MESFHNLIVNRRSIRKYTSEQLSPEDVQSLLEAALLAPTSKNSRAWHFVIIEDKNDLERLSHCKSNYATSIAGCALAIVIAMDEAKDEAYIEDAAVAASYIQLQAADLGLGSCWVQVRGRFSADNESSEEIVREITGIPDEFPVICIVSIGHKDEKRRPQNLEKLKWESVHIGRYRND